MKFGIGKTAIESCLVGPLNGIEFDIRLYRFGVYMCHRYIKDGTSKVEQSNVFCDSDSFSSWFDSSNIKHDEAVLQADLKRCVHEYFAKLRVFRACKL